MGNGNIILKANSPYKRDRERRTRVWRATREENPANLCNVRSEERQAVI
jgi:hypothetical protein